MSYDLEAINTLFAQIAECMHRNPARAMRLLGQAKARVQAALERSANCQAVQLAAPQASAPAPSLPKGWQLAMNLCIDAIENAPPEGEEWPVNWLAIRLGLVQLRDALLGGAEPEASAEAIAYANSLPEVRCAKCDMKVLSKCSSDCPVPDAYANRPAEESAKGAGDVALPNALYGRFRQAPPYRIDRENWRFCSAGNINESLRQLSDVHTNPELKNYGAKGEVIEVEWLFTADQMRAAVLADRQQRGGDVERIRNAGAILDCLTSKLGSDHPLRVEAAEGAKQAVADLYRIAEQIDAAIPAQQLQEGK